MEPSKINAVRLSYMRIPPEEFIKPEVKEILKSGPYEPSSLSSTTHILYDKLRVVTFVL
jgi:hypothetical protein